MLEIEDSFEEINSIDFFMNRADCDINDTDDDGYTALHYAVQNCSIRAIARLLKNGADVHLRTKEYKLTALHFAVRKEHNLSVVKCLVNAGAIVESTNIEELTPLQMSLLGGSTDVIEYLIDNGADVNRLEKNLQFTALHLTIFQRRYDLFQLLIDKGADVNASGKDGLTPLHLSSMLGCSDFTEALVRLGARVDHLYDERLTSLHVTALKSLHVDNMKLTGEDSICYGHEDSLVVKLLKDSHDFIDGQDYEGVIEILVCNGADINALTPDGKSPLHLALQSNFMDTLTALLKRGAQLNCKGNRCLYTLLYIIARNNDEITMKDYFDNNQTATILLRAIDALEDNEIKKAVICLFAIVDAGNVDGCMPVNFEIKNDYSDSSNSFRINRVNVNDLEVYSKFACDRVLSGALQALAYGDIESRKPSQYVYDYLSMLNAIKLPLTSSCITYSRTQSIADMYASDKVKTHFNSCLDEVDKMKFYAIDEYNSLYEVLHMRLKDRRFRMKKLNLDEIELEFPMYYKLILARYREDVVRKVLMDAVQLAFNEFSGIEIPIICVEEIFADLGVMNMIAIIQAAEMMD